MIQPVAEFAVRRGVKFQDFIELVREQFVHAASAQLSVAHKDQSVSRISVMTGLQRPEVNRLLRSEKKGEPKDMIVRVLGQWSSDRRFLDAKRRPRPLKLRGTSSEFAKLIRLVSTDLNPHTVRFELERLGLIRVERETAKLVRPEFISSGDVERILTFGSEDVNDLLRAVEGNAFVSSETPNLHARTQYDNIPDKHIAKLKTALLKLGRRFHSECRALLAPYDRDINPKATSMGGRNRIVVGTFSRVEELEGQDKEESNS
jgi:Family of unknown function (DUF6502)